MARHRFSAALAVACLSTASAGATVTEIGPADDLRAAVNALTPGDELVLRGGTYTLTFRFSIGVSGTAAQPIVIRAKAGETPHLTRDPNQNVINIEGARHLVLRELEVSGGSHGIRLQNSSFITVEDCHVHDTGDVGISANIPGNTYEGLRFLRNHIHHTGGTGEGFYIGCNNAGCTVFDSLIEGNYVHDTVAGTSQGDGIEVKHGSYNVTVRDNVIHDTRYPCILVYGTDGNPVNVVERNTMWGCGDHAIQAAADAIIRNNVILGAAADGIRNQIHQGATPSNLTITHNTVLNAGNAIRTNDVAGPVVIANNALYSETGYAIRAGGNTALVTSAGNVGTGSLLGVSGGFDPGGDRNRDFVDWMAMDVYLTGRSRLVASGDPAWVAADDRDGAGRGGVADVGAYLFAAGCLVGNLGPVADVRIAKDGLGGAVVSFTTDLAASEHHVNSVTDKRDLTDPGPHRPPVAGGVGAPECTAPGGAGWCTDVDAVGAGPLLYYQVLSACGPNGDDEGPIE